jgi:replicative DNA helicase
MKNLANQELEYTLIGELLFMPGKENLILALTEEDFSLRPLKAVIGAMKAICAEGGTADLVTVSDRLAGNEQAQKAALKASGENIGNRNAKSHLNALKQYTARRNVVKIAQNILMDAQSVDKDVLEVCDSAVAKIREAMPLRTSADESLHSVLMETIAVLGDVQNGKNQSVKINLDDFDRVTGGFFGGELTVIGARPGVGKSAFAQHIAMQFARQGKTVEFFSREMSRMQYGIRMLSAGSGIAGTCIRTGNMSDYEKKEMSAAVGRLSPLPIYINTTARNIPEILTICHERQQNNGLDLVVVDYLQLVNGLGKSREQEVSAVSRGLKEIALEFNIPVIALSQLNRSVGNKEPGLEHLRESGAIEQDADNIIFLHEEGDGQSETREMRIIIAKQRQGRTGYVDVSFIPDKMLFRSYYRG